MKLLNIIKSTIREYFYEQNSNNTLYDTLINLREDLILVSQKVYDEWNQNEHGYDEYYGSGGICDDIADAMCHNVINLKTNYGCFHIYNEYDCHTSIYVYDLATKQIYNVDIPPYIYESGTGYNWKKIKNVSFNVNHIDIIEVEWDNYFDNDGNLKDNLY